MATGNFVNLEKTSEMSLVKDKFLGSYWNKTFGNFYRKLKLKKAAFKLSLENPFSLVFVNLSQIISEGVLVIEINKVQSFSCN